MFAKKPPGRPRKLNQEQQNELIRKSLEHNFCPNSKLLSNMEPDFPTISSSTVARYLKENGIRTRIAAKKPELSADAVTSRLTHSLNGIERQPSDYSKTIFIDEFTVDTRSKRQRLVRRKANARYEQTNVNKYRMKHSKSFSFVICLNARSLGPLALIEGRFNAKKYLSYLHHQVMPYARRTFGEDFFLLHDNCPIHTARIVTNYLRENANGRVLSHPPYSPDLNPVEHVGNYIKRELSKFINVPNSELPTPNFTTIEQLWTLTNRICYSLNENKELLIKLASSMISRFSSVIDSDGWYTKY